MSDLIFLSSPAKSKEAVKATMYRCPKTHAQVIANECMIPMSPYVGQAMQRVTNSRITVSASELKEDDMKRVGHCKNCDHTLFASAKAINSLAKTKPHCIMCGSVVAMAPEMAEQVIPQVIKPEDIGDDVAVHNDMPDASDGDAKYAKVGLNDQLLASEILASMDDDEDDDGDSEDEDEGDWDEDGNDDEDDEDLGENDYMDDDDDEDEDSEEDYGDEDEGELGGGSTPDEEAEVNDSDDDSDDDMDATASDLGDDDDFSEMNDADGLDDTQANTVNMDDMTTMQGNRMADEAAQNKVNIGLTAADALHSIVSSDSAMLAVLPIDTSSAMVLAMVNDVGYMPYIALEASKASDNIKPLFANPSKLVETVNAVLANSEGNLIKDLASFGVRQLNYSIRASALIEKRIKEGVFAATEALNDEKGHLVDDLRQCLAIAATEVMKNLKEDATNVVASTLSDSLKKVGVRDASLLVDQAFTAQGPELMKTIIARALELMDKPYDSRNEIAKYVTAAVGRNVLETAKPTQGDVVAKNLAEGSLPVSVHASAGNVVEPSSAANVIPITASSNIDYSNLIKSKAASLRHRQAQNAR
jgi:hypothetical protein